MPRPYRYFISKGEEGQFVLHSRPPVSYNKGSSQGDHSTAFAMMVRTITRSVHYENMNDYIKGLKTRKEVPIYTHLFGLISNLNQLCDRFNKAHSFDDHPLIKSIMDEQTRKYSGQIGLKCRDINDLLGHIDIISNKFKEEQRALELLLILINVNDFQKIEEQAKIDNYLAREDAFTNYLANEYLKIRNKQVFVSFPAEGNKPNVVSEGSNIRKALGQLDILAQSPTPSNEEWNTLVEKVTNNVLATFWHPLILKTDKVSLKQSTTSARGKHTVYRDNALAILSFVCAAHIEEFNKAYPEFSSTQMNSSAEHYSLATDIKNLFLKKVAEGWSLNPEEIKQLTKEINNTLELSDASDFQSVNNSGPSSQDSEKTPDLELSSSPEKEQLSLSSRFETRTATDFFMSQYQSNQHKKRERSDAEIDALFHAYENRLSPFKSDSRRTESSDSDYDPLKSSNPLLSNDKIDKINKPKAP